MIRGFVKLVVSLVLAVVVFIAGLFAWGTTHNQRHGISWPVLLVSLIIGISCLWGLVRIWRSSDEDDGFDPIARRRESESQPGAVFDDDEFTAWLAANDFDSVALPPETMAELRQRFIEQKQ
jgi:hypothetical protein